MTYALCQNIGSGSFGQVKMAYEEESGNPFAIKMFDPDEDNAINVGTMREISLLVELKGKHPNILSPVDIVTLEDQLCMVMPRYQGNFEDIINGKGLKNEQKLKISFQLLDAVDFMHQNNLIHRDIKSSNILLDEDMNLILADFSLAKYFVGDETFSHTVDVGTPTYRAPEICNKETYKLVSDEWSVGVVICEIFTNSVIKVEKDRHAVSYLHDILDKLPNKQIPNMIRGLLTVDPTKRLTCKEAKKLDCFAKYTAHVSDYHCDIFWPQTAEDYQKFYEITYGTAVDEEDTITFVDCEYFVDKMFSEEYSSVDDAFEDGDADCYLEIEGEIFKKMDYNIYINKNIINQMSIQIKKKGKKTKTKNQK